MEGKIQALEAGAWRLEVLPELGGAIGRLAFDGEDVLRPSPKGTADPLDTACFPLVPFANRVAGARFAFGDREFTLPTLPRFHPHALHGEAWRKPWTITDVSEQSITLECRGGDEWPWPYAARQRITLQKRQAVIELALTNTGATPMPAGLGLHPYFMTAPDTRLAFTADGVWLGPSGGIPEKLGKLQDLFDFAAGPRIEDTPNIDHCYADWRGEALITTRTREISITATPNASYAHVHTPRGEPFFCFEPATHHPNALNSLNTDATGLVVLAPDASVSMTMTLSIRRDVDKSLRSAFRSPPGAAQTPSAPPTSSSRVGATPLIRELCPKFRTPFGPVCRVKTNSLGAFPTRLSG